MVARSREVADAPTVHEAPCRRRRRAGMIRPLRRRGVFRVAVAYLAGGFVLLQVAETILPPMGWDTAHTAVVVLVLGGLPVALVLAWIFDVSPEGWW